MYIIYISIVLFYGPYYNFENCKGLLYNNIYTVAQSSFGNKLILAVLHLKPFRKQFIQKLIEFAINYKLQF